MRTTILCAALWIDDGKKRGNQPENIPTGVVFGGHRMISCIEQSAANGRLQGPRTEGFLTSDNHFLTREEAVLVAAVADQLLSVPSDGRLRTINLY